MDISDHAIIFNNYAERNLCSVEMRSWVTLTMSTRPTCHVSGAVVTEWQGFFSKCKNQLFAFMWTDSMAANSCLQVLSSVISMQSANSVLRLRIHTRRVQKNSSPGNKETLRNTIGWKRDRSQWNTHSNQICAEWLTIMKMNESDALREKKLQFIACQL